MWTPWFKGRTSPTIPQASRLPPATFPILRARELLFARSGQIQRLAELSATTTLHFERYYLTALRRFATWAQQLPASQAHHHAHPGGLLDHVLEVAVTALQIRMGHLLPLGGLPEDIAQGRDRWTYAVFAAALIHDAGKPAVDQRIELFSRDGTSLGPWNPWAGGMAEHPGAVAYRTEFRRDRQYRLHEKAALLIAPRLFSAEALAWLAEDRACFSAWLGYASGDAVQAGVLGEILGRADGHSVARNLGAEASPRAAAGTVIPLYEKLVTALRYLIENQKLPLNRSGAAGWLVGDDLWMVSKRTVDDLRLHLSQGGHQGIPTANDRIFDVLQEHGVLTPNGEKAIWRAEVRGDGYVHTLPLLRIPAARLWADRSLWPEPLAGQVVIPETLPAQDPAALAAPPSPPVPIAKASTFLEVPPQTATPESVPVLPAAPVANAEEGFLAWLRQGLVSKTITCNQADARVHVVAEGILLLSPGLFMDFAEANPGEAVDREIWTRKGKS